MSYKHSQSYFLNHRTLIGLKWSLVFGLAIWAESKGWVSKALTHLLTFDPLILSLGGALITLSLLIGVLRWFCFLKAFHLPRPSLRRGLLLYYIGLFYNTYLPGAVGGDVLRGYGYQSQTGETSSLAYLIPFGERLMGLVSLGCWFLMGASSFLKVHPIGDTLHLYFQLYWSYGLFLITLVMVLIRIGRLHRYAYTALYKRLPFLSSFSLTFPKSPWYLGVAFLLNLLSHGCSMLIYLLLGSALGIQLEINQWLFALSITLFLSHLPLSIAGLGTREVSLVSTLSLYHVSSDLALSLSFSVLALLLMQAALGGGLHLLFPLKEST